MMFEEPTDSEISALFNGIPVLSFRPEDLPHFRKPGSSYTPDEISARVAEAIIHLQDFHPGWAGNPVKMIELAAGSSAMLSSFWPKEGSRPSHIVLRRPSKHVSPAEELAHMSGIPADLIDFPVPKADIDFVDVFHELGHLEQFMSRGHTEGTTRAAYQSELETESLALKLYLKEGGSRAVVDAMIRGRIVSGFTKQTSEYFLGPGLRAHFNGHAAAPDFNDIRLAYFELRTRIVGHLLGKPLTDHSSAALHIAINARDAATSERGSEPFLTELEAAVDRATTIIDDPRPMHEQGRRLLFTPLPAILRQSGLSPVTQACGVQILDAARRITPDYLAEKAKPAATPPRP